MRHPFGVRNIICISISLITTILHGNDPIGFLYALEPTIQFVSWNAYSGAAHFAIIVFIGLEGFSTFLWLRNSFNKRILVGLIAWYVLGLVLAGLSQHNWNELNLWSIVYLVLLFLSSLSGILNSLITLRCNNYQEVHGSVKNILSYLLSFVFSSALPLFTLTKQPIINTLFWKNGITLHSLFSASRNIFIVDNGEQSPILRWIDTNETQLWIIVPNLKTSNEKVFSAINSFAMEAEKNGINVKGLAVGTPFEIEDFRHEMQTPFPFYGTQHAFMRRYTRANPTIVLIDKGKVVNIWTASNFPESITFSKDLNKN
jgi:hypothetical protein